MSTQDELQDYYKILNVERTVDESNLYEAYTMLVKKFSLPPGAPKGAEERRDTEFAKFKNAYSVLSNPPERKNYDLQLLLQEKKKLEEYVKNKLDNNDEDEQEIPFDLQSSLQLKNASGLAEKRGLDERKKEYDQLEKQKTDEIFLKAKKCLKHGNEDIAINLLREIVQKNPKVAIYHSYLGLAMQAKGWTGYSQAEFKVALHFDPYDEIALKYYKSSQKPEDKKTGFLSNLFKKK